LSINSIQLDPYGSEGFAFPAINNWALYFLINSSALSSIIFVPFYSAILPKYENNIFFGHNFR
jgi:hypothetical protein